jgi:hypothetical protein
VWCKAGSPVTAELTARPTGGMTAADLSFEIAAPSGRTLIAGADKARGVVADTGWHALSVMAAADATGSAAFELSLTYTGTGSV